MYLPHGLSRVSFACRGAHSNNRRPQRKSVASSPKSQADCARTTFASVSQHWTTLCAVATSIACCSQGRPSKSRLESKVSVAHHQRSSWHPFYLLCCVCWTVRLCRLGSSESRLHSSLLHQPTRMSMVRIWHCWNRGCPSPSLRRGDQRTHLPSCSLLSLERKGATKEVTH